MTIWKFAYNTLFPKIGEKGKRFENVKRQWCNITLARWFWAIKTCPWQVMSVWSPDWASNFFIQLLSLYPIIHVNYVVILQRTLLWFSESDL